ncbi:MAG TPA: ABC transporter permease [Candidatus Acidoferrales bacterium]|nr:ABC transporter permease [Candidatus Acidoferrales bacterium]
MWQDVKFAVRMLGKAPGFTAVAVLTLALGIGANTAIFSAVNGILLEPLPYTDASQLLSIGSVKVASSTSLYDAVSAGAVKDVEAQCPAIGQLAEYESSGYRLTGQTAPELLSGASVSGNFFTLLGVRPMLGRPILPSDTVAGNDDVVVVSHGVWKGLLGGDPHWIGKKITLNGKEYAVVGVMPREFTYGAGERGVWLPSVQASDDTDRESRGAQVVARLKPGATLTQAQAQLETLSARLAAAYPKTDGGWKLSANGVEQGEFDYGDFSQDLLLQLLGAVGFVLLIACVNVSALLLARGWVRQKEVAIRQALGATRLRIIRQFLAESILLALAGGALGLVLSVWGIWLVRAAAPPDTPRLSNVQLDANVFWFALGVSLLAGILFGVTPALQASARRAGTTFHENLSHALPGFSGRSPRNQRSALVVVEVALAVILVVGAALSIRSFENWASIDWGFRTDHVLTMTVNFSKAVCDADNKNSATQCHLAVQEILNRVKSLPGVEKVAAVSTIPLEGVGPAMSVSIQGRTQKLGFSNGAPIFYRIVTPEYLDAVGVGFLKGRDFTDGDTQGADRVAIVNETFAKKFLSGQPLGKQFSFVGLIPNAKNAQPEWTTVVGEVRNTLVFGPTAPPMPEFYEPYAQSEQGMAGNLIVRTTEDPRAMTVAVKQQVWSVDKDAPLTNLKTMNQVVAQRVAQPRFQALLLGSFGALGLILAMVGIYGVISYGLTQRTREIGVRMALGAQPRDVLRMVIREGMLPAGLGIVAGVAGALALGRVLRSLLFEIKPTDPATFIGVAAVLSIVALAACWIPARRAMRIEPMEALRYE